MKKPHKHAELIKAWADGCRIECYSHHFEKWIDVDHNPSWRDDRNYRIKPEPKPDVVKVINFDSVIREEKNLFVSTNNHGLHAHWENHVKLTFDGETGKLKSAEVIDND